MIRTFLKVFILVSVLVFPGCQKTGSFSPVAITVDDIKITVDEFEDAFRNSPYAKNDLPSERKEFLDFFITRRLILREAEREGLDRDPEFLKSIELFWQQSLLKLILDNKIKKLSSGITITEDEMREYYRHNQDTIFKDTGFEDVREQIEKILRITKTRQVLKSWTESLGEKSRINVNHDLLSIKD